MKLNENEKEVLEAVIFKGKGLVVKSKTEAIKRYPNLINENIVYIDSFGSGKTVALKLTNKGTEYKNSL